MTRFFVGLWLAIVLTSSPAAAQQFPAFTAPVVDQADVLTAAQEVDLNSKLRALLAQSGRPFVIATVDNLQGYEIADYATRLGRAWKIGDEQKDNGVVMVIAPTERKVWIASGYGADDVLTDTMTGLIIRTQIIPRFKAGDMGGGIIAGADAVIEQLKLPPEEAARQAKLAEQAQRAPPGGGIPIVPIVFVMVFLFMVLNGLRRSLGGGRRYRGRHGGISPWIVLWGVNQLARGSGSDSGSGWGGGSGSWGGGSDSWGGGSGGGFSGGGSFGGGGAGGSW